MTQSHFGRPSLELGALTPIYSHIQSGFLRPRRGMGETPYEDGRNCRIKVTQMSDSQRFPVAAHTLAYLAHRNAYSREQAVSSSVLAASIPTNPVVIRRMTTQLAKAGLLATCSGVSGGAWLLKKPEHIKLDEVLKAVNGCAHLGSAPLGAEGCPVSQAIPKAVNEAMTAANIAAAKSLSTFTVADLLKHTAELPVECAV